jgi:hypothetical protein
MPSANGYSYNAVNAGREQTTSRRSLVEHMPPDDHRRDADRGIAGAGHET